MTVNLSATFKEDQKILNGLEAIAGQLVNDPLRRHTIVAVVETKFVKTDYDAGGTATPTVRLVHVEPLSGDDAETARKLLQEAYQERTGRDDNPAEATLFDDGDGD